MIRGLYKQNVVTMTSDKTVKEAATMMRDRNIGDVVIVDRVENAGRNATTPIGIITDRDIVVSCLAEGKTDIDKIRVGDVMSRNIACVKEDVGLFDAIRAMRDAGVGRLLVVDDNRCLMGIMTAQEVFNLLNDELHELGMIARERRETNRMGNADEMRLPPNLTEEQAESFRH